MHGSLYVPMYEGCTCILWECLSLHECIMLYVHIYTQHAHVSLSSRSRCQHQDASRSLLCIIEKYTSCIHSGVYITSRCLARSIHCLPFGGVSPSPQRHSPSSLPVIIHVQCAAAHWLPSQTCPSHQSPSSRLARLRTLIWGRNVTRPTWEKQISIPCTAVWPGQGHEREMFNKNNIDNDGTHQRPPYSPS
jgi:hypothetical protein